MIQEIRLPEVSENVESGDIAKVLVQIGDRVEVDQSLIEIETDKAVVEVPSPVAGKVMEILVEAGQTVKIGQVFMKIDAGGVKDAEVAAESPEPPKSSADKPEFSPAPQPMKSDDDHRPPMSAAIPPAKAVTDDGPRHPPAPASPSVRRLARELGIDIDAVTGTGPGGRISEADVKSAAKSIIQTTSTAQSTASQVRPLPDLSKWGEVERRPLSRVRQITADAMSYGWSNIPHVFQFDKADITDLDKFRAAFSRPVEAAGGKLTVTAVLVKIIASALKRFPQFNAALDIPGKALIYRKYIHIGVAVDTDRGLLVPVIRNADEKSITQIAVELTELAEKCRRHKVSPDELQGGGFTISNLGGIGGTSFTPIIYWPQVAILGVDRARMEPVWRDGQFTPRLMLPLTLSYDHRIIDGADAARFISWLVQSLESPLRVWLD